MKSPWKLSLITTLLLGLSVGCGGNDPLLLVNDPTTGTVVFTIPFSNTLTTSQQQSYSSTHPSYEWTFNVLAGNTQTNVTAPATGVVIAIDGTSTAASVTVLHNSRVTYVLAKMNAVSVRVGDYVVGGTTIVGSLSTSLAFLLTIDGVSTCPYSFFHPDWRTYIQTYLLGLAPCS